MGADASNDGSSGLSIFAIVGFEPTYVEKEAPKYFKSNEEWNNIFSSGKLSQDEVEIIKSILNKNADENPEKLPGKLYLFTQLVSKLKETPFIGHTMFLLYKLCKKILRLLNSYDEFLKSGHISPLNEVLKSTESGDLFVRIMALSIASMFLAELQWLPQECNEFRDRVIKCLSYGLSTTNQLALDYVLQLLQNLLSAQGIRIHVYESQDIMNKIREFISREDSTIQMQYQSIYCIWLLTLEKEIAAKIDTRYPIISHLAKISRETSKEKIVRISILVFVNLFTLGFDENIFNAVGHKLPALISTLSSRHWSDTEIEDNLKFLKGEMYRATSLLSTWDEYKCEVMSSKLAWSPVHLSEAFWKENAHKLQDNDNELLKRVIEVMKNASDEESLAVAVSDIGNYAKYNPAGGPELVKLDAKGAVMALIEHESAQVRYQAITASQKIISMI